uniref:hypothetical protein n=1 Tax=uncultured Caulobacter sp. TaxID=158749 RepID=UPI0025CCAE68|nr:hypothetical protein [uncultured Caulobacter sp.]
MNKTINRLKYIFLGLFLLGSAGVLAYHAMWVWPKEKCEARGGAWAGKWLKCATVYPIETMTRRPTGTPPINGEKVEAPAAKAAPAAAASEKK